MHRPLTIYRDPNRVVVYHLRELVQSCARGTLGAGGRLAAREE
jgi:hypothetical protein